MIVQRDSDIAHPVHAFEALLQAPNPDRRLPILISQPFDISGCEAAPSVVQSGRDLDSLHLIRLFHERPQVSVHDIMLLVQARKQLLTCLPPLKGNQTGVELVLIQLHDAAWVVKDPIEVRPVADSLSRERRWLQPGVEGLLVGARGDGVGFLDDGPATPQRRRRSFHLLLLLLLSRAVRVVAAAVVVGDVVEGVDLFERAEAAL